MKLLGWPALMLLVLQGCAQEPGPGGEARQADQRSGMHHERMMHARWAGRDYRELIAERGEPIYEMTIPRYGWPNSSALLYGLDEQSGCIDAFLIIKGDDRTWIEDYYCR